jgi:hypothetical protein
VRNAVAQLRILPSHDRPSSFQYDHTATNMLPRQAVVSRVSANALYGWNCHLIIHTVTDQLGREKSEPGISDEQRVIRECTNLFGREESNAYTLTYPHMHICYGRCPGAPHRETTVSKVAVLAEQPEQERSSNVVELRLYRQQKPEQQQKPAEYPYWVSALDWPAGVLIAWELAYS